MSGGREMPFGVSEKRPFFLSFAKGAFLLVRTRKPVKNNCARLLPNILFF